jgi:hypothetical protein
MHATFKITGSFDPDAIYCTGSLTKLLTTYVVLSKISEKFSLEKILDDDNFFDSICNNSASKNFLKIFQRIIGRQFSLRDICSYYAGLPYTFDVTPEEIAKVEAGQPFKHHSIPDEETFLKLCQEYITPVYTNRCKFHYSEISILFLGYLIEKIDDTTMEELYQEFLINKSALKKSIFSRKKVPNCIIQDLSDHYDYPSIAIVDHGYFCYSNGFYTTLNEMKTLMTHLLNEPVFKTMTDIHFARAASNRIMNGLTVELRQVRNDILYGYEGLSFSCCNLWAYSNNEQTGYLTCSNSEEEIYTEIYDQMLGYSDFETVPANTQTIYQDFLKSYHEKFENKEIPAEYQGEYQRVRINEKNLDAIFTLGNNFMTIRNPEIIRYDVVFVKNNFRVKGKDGVHGAKVGLIKSEKGQCYFYYDGTLYRKI